MYRYLRAIGFSKFNKKRQADVLIQNMISNPDTKQTAMDLQKNEITEITCTFHPRIGITICGEYQDDCFYMDFFFPVFYGEEISTREPIEVEQRTESNSYAGVCDEMRLGVTLIFYLQNVAEYLNEKNKYCGNYMSTTLSALSLGGKIILPISKNEKQIENIKKNTRNRNHLIAAAREGDEDAIESLTLEDIDTYSMISRRVVQEDILTIVDSYFMPYGIESDQYSVLGEIVDVKTISNEMTKEELYLLKVNSNDIIFDVCINKMDLFGEPEVGRRFKGNVWMQGKINYQ